MYKRRIAIGNLAIERDVREKLDMERRDSKYRLSIEIRHKASMHRMRLYQNIGVFSLQSRYKDPDAELQLFLLSFYLSSDLSIYIDIIVRLRDDDITWIPRVEL